MNCTFTAREVTFTGLVGFGNGSTLANGVVATIDRCSLTNSTSTFSIDGPPQAITFHMTNSIAATVPSFTFQTTSAATDIVFSFNTFFGGSAQVLCNSPFPPGVSFDDNIINSPMVSNTVPSTTNCVFDTNVIFPQSSSVGINTIALNPQLVAPSNGDFHLKTGSPAIGHAKPTATDLVDYDGVSRPPGMADIGALQFVP
jgi:hypothetical protein